MIADSMVSLVKNSSVIRAMFEEGNRLAKLYGAENVYDFSLGNPNVPAPAEVNEAVKDIVDNEESTFIHGYMSNAGYEDVRQTIAESLNRRFGTHFNHTNIVMTVGAAGGLNTIFKTLLNPGEEVMTFAPFFGEYRNYVSNFGGKLVVVSPNTVDFQPKLDEFEAKITPKTRAVIVNNPNNPTGAIMTKEELAELVPVIIDNDLYVISDEIYSELTYVDKHVSIASFPGMKERTVLINGFSKAYAMTGWRLGYACAPETILKQMLKIHQFAIMCAPTTSQYAAVEAMKNGDEDVAQMRDEYNGRRRYVLHRFKEMGLKCFEPFGAFYAFPSIKEFGMTSDEFATKLLNSKKIAVVPGTAFGECGEGFLRISYAYSLDDLKEALGRIEEFVTELRAGMDNK